VANKSQLRSMSIDAFRVRAGGPYLPQVVPNVENVILRREMLSSSILEARDARVCRGT